MIFYFRSLYSQSWAMALHSCRFSSLVRRNHVKQKIRRLTNLRLFIKLSNVVHCCATPLLFMCLHNKHDQSKFNTVLTRSSEAGLLTMVARNIFNIHIDITKLSVQKEMVSNRTMVHVRFRLVVSVSANVCPMSVRIPMFLSALRPKASEPRLCPNISESLYIYRLLMWLLSNNFSWPEVLLTLSVVFRIP